MSSSTLPSSAFEALLPKLLNILKVTERPEGTSNARNKQDLLTGIQTFREALNQARDLANGLPGGESLIEEQEEMIVILERLKAKKKLQLREFSEKVIHTKGHSVPQYLHYQQQHHHSFGQNQQMEVDSNASTPA